MSETVKFTAECEIDVRMVATLFAGLDSTKQAEFFVHLAQVVRDTYCGNSYGEMQWMYMSDDLRLPENIEGYRLYMSMCYSAYRLFPVNQSMAAHEYSQPYPKEAAQ